MSLKDEKIGIIGSGYIGRNWAKLFASVGYNVSLYDSNPATVKEALDDIKVQLEEHQFHGSLKGHMNAGQQFDLITEASTIANCMEGAIHIQEAVSENVLQKQIVFQEMDSLAEDCQVLCSSTSTVDPHEFSENLKHRSQVILAHPTSLPYYIPLTEIVLTPWTSELVLNRTRALLVDMGQSAVVCKKFLPGIASNRIIYSVLNECWRLVEANVISVEDIDTVMTEGLAMRYAFMGPMETAHIRREGIEKYCWHYKSRIEKVSKTFGPSPFWEGPTMNRLESDLAARVPSDRIEERKAWRNTCLLALSKLKKNILIT